MPQAKVGLKAQSRPSDWMQDSCPNNVVQLDEYLDEYLEAASNCSSCWVLYFSCLTFTVDGQNDKRLATTRRQRQACTLSSRKFQPPCRRKVRTDRLSLRAYYIWGERDCAFIGMEGAREQGDVRKVVSSIFIQTYLIEKFYIISAIHGFQTWTPT